LSDESEKPSDLITVTDLLEIIKFFDEGAKSKAGIMVWTKGSENTANCHVIGLSQTEKMIYTTIPISNDSSTLYANLTAAGERCFLNMKIERASLFFNAKLHSHSFANLQFTLPEKLFKVQRRLNQRFKILQGYVLRVSFRDPITPTLEHRPKIFDISSGGLSFLVDTDAASPFPKGQILKNLTFTIRTYELHLEGEVVHFQPIIEDLQRSNVSKIKVGVRFRNISEADLAIIEEYVFDENRKFFSRFM
jgi:c-di-GMP-binding flagellar brake protein YcgR